MSYQPIDENEIEAPASPSPPPTTTNVKGISISQGRVIFLAVGMVLTGSLNTLSTKLADESRAEDTWDTRDKNGASPQFQHPLLQALGMFIGESLCLVAYFAYVFLSKRKGYEYEKPSPGFKPYVFIIPACCDLTATSMMYIGLTYTYASVFQMLRGAVIIFTGVLSVLFLKRKLRVFHWIGMAVILGGLSTVGIASLGDKGDATNPVLGDILVISSQLIAACQMVVEEKLLDGHNVPSLMAVGLEGCFGATIMFLLMFPMYYIPINITTQGYMENALDAFVQMRHSWVIILASVGNILSIAFFNYFGVTVTKNLSATTRMVLDSVRTITIWGVSLAVGWEKFSYLQIIGFTILLTGTAIYYQYLNYSQVQRALILGKCMKPEPVLETPIDHVTSAEYTRLDDDKIINQAQTVA